MLNFLNKKSEGGVIFYLTFKTRCVTILVKDEGIRGDNRLVD